MSRVKPLVLAGAVCLSDPRGGAAVPARRHWVAHPAKDAELLQVREWLLALPLAELFTRAVEEAVQYVLDGSRTGRFDLNDPEVDSDERATVGTKLQYRVLDVLGLEKLKPLDTMIAGVAVDIKGTVRTNWSIPREAQCGVCILVQVDATRDRHRAHLMRTHRVWLNEGSNSDGKRSIASKALRAYSVPLYDWTDLPANPLKLLDPAQRAAVWAPGVGQEKRLTALFGALPDVVVPRWAILTVCFNRDDPMRRSRAVKDAVARCHGLRVYVGRWPGERAEAEALGFTLGTSGWVATARTIGPHLPPTSGP